MRASLEAVLELDGRKTKCREGMVAAARTAWAGSDCFSCYIRTRSARSLGPVPCLARPGLVYLATHWYDFLAGSRLMIYLTGADGALICMICYYYLLS